MADRPDPIAVRIPEACRMTGIGRSKLYELIRDREIGIAKVGAVTLVPVAGLRAFIDRQAQCHFNAQASVALRPGMPLRPARLECLSNLDPDTPRDPISF